MGLILVSSFLGLLLFLLGMNMIKTGLELLAQNKVKLLIKKFTATPFRGMITGTVTTFAIQSSSAVTVITISLVNSGMMTIRQALGIVLGTNIGTCITALLFTFDILNYFPLLLICGLLLTINNKPIAKFSGVTMAGFGLVFWGLITLQQGFLPLKDSPAAVSFLTAMSEYHFTGIIAGTIFTAFIQSSSAVTGIVIALALQDLISLPGAIAIILGSNVGTCITALLASLTATRNAKRVAYAHVLLNLLGVIMFFPFISSFANLLTAFVPLLTAQIAWGQIVFNVFSSFVALPFTNQFAKFLTKY